MPVWQGYNTAVNTAQQKDVKGQYEWKEQQCLGHSLRKSIDPDFSCTTLHNTAHCMYRQAQVPWRYGFWFLMNCPDGCCTRHTFSRLMFIHCSAQPHASQASLWPPCYCMQLWLPLNAHVVWSHKQNVRLMEVLLLQKKRCQTRNSWSTFVYLIEAPPSHFGRQGKFFSQFAQTTGQTRVVWVHLRWYAPEPRYNVMGYERIKFSLKSPSAYMGKLTLNGYDELKSSTNLKIGTRLHKKNCFRRCVQFDAVIKKSCGPTKLLYITTLSHMHWYVLPPSSNLLQTCHPCFIFFFLLTAANFNA